MDNITIYDKNIEDLYDICMYMGYIIQHTVRKEKNKGKDVEKNVEKIV